MTDSLAELRNYIQGQWSNAEAAIAKSKPPFKYRASKAERQSTFTKGASCAYEDILHHIANLKIAETGHTERVERLVEALRGIQHACESHSGASKFDIGNVAERAIALFDQPVAPKEVK